MENQYDVIIVGAGPIGGYTASLLAKQNIKTLVIEQHKNVGKPVSCAGLVTPRVFDIFNIPKNDIIQNQIKGANIHSPSGKILSIGGDKLNALSIDRYKFDNFFINEAKKNNAALLLDNKVISAQKYQDHIEIQTSKNNQYQSKILIGADGPYSKIRDVFGLPQPKEYVRGIGANVNDANLDPDFVEIFMGKNIAPGFFAWIIPTNSKGSKARIGLCINQQNPKPPVFYFNNFLTNQHTKEYLENISIEERNAGIIPLGPLKQTVTDNVMLVGDAAGQVKPTSGGGIYPGLVCAKHCINTVKKALDTNQFSADFLGKYHEEWRNDIGKELFLGMQFRKLFLNLTDNHFEKYINKFRHENISSLITKHGDIDYPSKLLKPLLKKMPTLLSLLPQLLK